MKSPIGILGAGITGCCLALELAQRGYFVDLIDKKQLAMTAASLNNEGKLHLGFVYAKDKENATHNLMIQGSLAFTSIIERLTNQNVEDFKPSKPFQYFIPNDSMLSMDEIELHFNEVQNVIDNEISATGLNYLNNTEKRFFYRNSKLQHKNSFSEKHTLGSFTTQEYSVSTYAISEMLQKAIDINENINLITNTEVVSVNIRSDKSIDVNLKQANEDHKVNYKCVANCLWEDKIRIDKTAGIIDKTPYLLRYKAMIKINAPQLNFAHFPSATGILGSYGDFVNHNDGTYYLSWYPLCKLAQTTNTNGPLLADIVHKNPIRFLKKFISKNYPERSDQITTVTHKRFISKNLKMMRQYIPSLDQILKSSKECVLSGGVILAKGKTDIDDPSSDLHNRTAVGAVAYENYVSIDTGKYCTGPLFAIEAAQMINEIMR